MTIKIFSTDTLCPNCGTDIYSAVHQKYFESASGYFDIPCPVCNTLFSVDAEPVPSFKFIGRPTLRAVDAATGAQADGASDTRRATDA